MATPPLILASSSPRRRQLMVEWGYEFAVVPPHESAELVNEVAGETAPQLVARLAGQKARDVALRVESGLVIGCDTVAECGGQILGKPASREHARRMLELLRGSEHRVYSGLCLWRRPDDMHRVEVNTTKLVMDPLSDAAIASYLDTGDWEGKAGAFGYQDGLDWVHVTQGSESNVVGLPMELLEQMLEMLDPGR